MSFNPPRTPRVGAVVVHDRMPHATYDPAAVATQVHLDELNGERATYCVATRQRWGFHEVGLWSAVGVAAHLGVERP